MRTPITLKIKFKSSNLEQFIERYSVDVSRGGIFIRTKEPLPVGTQLRFEFQLQDAQSLIAGDGTVVWIREHDPARQGVAPGMGVRFDKLAVESQKVLDKILAEKNKRGDAQLESRFDAGVRASASASGTLSTQPARPSGRDDFSGGDSKTNTPLPGAVPGLEAPGDEFGNESTRVMQNELVQSLADRTRDRQHDEAAAAANAFGEPEPTRKASVEELKLAVASAMPSQKIEPKVQVAPEAQPAVVPLADLKTPSLEAKEEPKPEPKVEPAPKIEAKPEPKIEAKEPKKEEARPLEKRDDVPLRVVDKAPREDVRAAVAITPPGPPPERRSGGGGMWIALGGVAIVAAVGGYFVFHKGDEQQQPTPPPVAQDNPKPAETAPPPPKVDTPPSGAVAANPTPPPVEEKPAGPSVAVNSEPPGATVTVDGKALPDPTPTTISGVDLKKVYDVRVSLKGFHDWKVKLKPKANDKLDAALVPNEKLVEVSSTPAGADVVLDGKRVGRTPYTIHKFDLSKAHAIEVKRSGYVTQSHNVTATDAFEPKGDKDVLALALTLEAEPKAEKAAPSTAKHTTPSKPSHPVATKKPDEKQPSEKPADNNNALPPPPSTDKPTEAATPSAAPDKPAEAAPAEKPAPTETAPATDKSADKPAASDKPPVKVPSWMQDKPADKPATDKPADSQPQQ